MKVRDLIQFEEVKEVIAIDSIDNPQDIVLKYVISQKMKNQLLELVSQLRQNKHKSINVIGDYGTGKSHLLAFISLVLRNNDLRVLVQDNQVRDALVAIDREYLIVQFELPATQEISLAEIFYDQLQDQLKNRYNIEVKGFDLKKDYDHKKYLGEVVATIKTKNPNLGLIVIVDEVSDFMKQKKKNDMHFDLQFLRQIGEVSQSIDFLYIGSMQEHVFTNPKYVDQAESISRVKERFSDINITKEEINRVIGNRVVKKNSEQILTLRELFKDLKKHFPNLNTDEDLYILLYPVHPYIVDLFKQLPYFEHRGIISFVVDETRRILDCDFPVFITYDHIYDLIERTHSIKNLEEVRPIIEIVRNLDSKIDLLDPRLQEDARKIVKALAVLHLAMASGQNGATAQELVNNLFIYPEGNLIDAADNIERILKKIRDVTSGQFIARTTEGIYSIDLKARIDFEFKIQQEADYNLAQGAEEEEFRKLLAEKLALSNSYGKSVYDDSCSWLSRNSFKKGWFIIETSDTEAVPIEPRDYEFHVLSNHRDQSAFKINEGSIILKPTFDEETISSFKRLAAIKQLIGENYYKDIMLAKRDEAYIKCAEKLKECIINHGLIESGASKRVNTIVPSSANLDSLISSLKTLLLEDKFARIYPKHPTFGQKISAQNVRGTVSSIIKDITSRGLSDLGNQSLNILRSLDLVDGTSVETTHSEFVKKILEMLENAEGKNLPTEEIVQELSNSPYGLPREITYLILSVLLFNGEVIFVEKGGKRIYASDFSEVFKRELEYFDDVKYILPEEEVPVKLIDVVFDAFQLQKGLIRNQKTWPTALRSFREKIIKTRDDIQEINDSIQRVIDDKYLPLVELQKTITLLKGFPIEKMEKVKNSLADFKRLNLQDVEIEDLKANYLIINQLLAAFHDYFDEIRQGLRYMDDGLSVLSANDIFPAVEVQELNTISEESKEIVADLKKLLSEDQRRPLKGKIQQFKRSFVHLYFKMHEKTVGKNVPWGQLERILQSNQYRQLKILENLRCVSKAPLLELSFEVSKIKEKRCEKLTPEDLEILPKCRHCQFPEKVSAPLNLDEKVKELDDRIGQIRKNWEKQILSEIEKNNKQFDMLSAAEKKLIAEIINARKLPDNISEETVEALNVLFQNLTVIPISMREFFNYLTSKSDVLTFEELAQLIEEFKKEKLKGSDPISIRFRIEKMDSNGAN